MLNLKLLDIIKQNCKPLNPYFIYAVAMVESAGKAFAVNGYPIVRFEKHVMLKYLKNNKELSDKVKKISSADYNAYTKACNVDTNLAMLSTSFGMFQIMGFNHKNAGYNTVDDFVKGMKESVDNQIEAFVHFVTKEGLVSFINNKEFAKFAYRYNGPNYKVNSYDLKLKKYFDEICGK